MPRYAETEKKKHVKNFKASGLQMSEYAEKNNISLSSLGRWKKEYSKGGFR